MRRIALPLLALTLAALACNLTRRPPTPAPTPLALADLTALPGGAPTPAPGAGDEWPTYTVAPGDTLSEIAEKTGSTVVDLAAANALADPSRIFVGQVLVIPQTMDAAGGTHTVASGETLGQIARLYGVSVNALSAANGISDPDRIYAGQTLRIPGAPTPATTSRVLLDVPIVKQSRNLDCESATACSLMLAMGYACASDMAVFNALPLSYDNPHRGFVGPVDSPAGSLPPGAASEWVGGYGVYVEPMQTALSRLGVNAQYIYNATLDMLRDRLDQSAPALIITTHGMGIYGYAPVSYVPTDGDGNPVTVIRYQHSYAVIGYDDAGFWVIDPWSGSVDYFANAALDADWARLGRQALWVLPA